MSYRLLLFSTFFHFSAFLAGQGIQIQGIVLDAKDQSPLLGVTVVIIRIPDSLKTGAITDEAGRFLISNVQAGQYVLRTAYISYLSTEKQLEIDSTDLDLGTVYIAQDAKLLEEVVVKDRQIRQQQLGDTTQFNADAFKTNPNATVEDLVQKMPGITLENGTVKVQGEELKKVTIDGEDFFGDDATLALKNLPAEIVDKIQVFDRLSEQAQFSGFDDGNSQKTLNIVTKSGKSNGQFGKIYTGYGSDERYIAGANLNYFKGKRRISLVGLSNNLNQQNFSAQDLLGVTGSAGGGGNAGGGGRRGGEGGGGGRQGGESANNFLVGQQAGVSQVHSIGLNYSDRWGKKFRVNASYFFNRNDNENNTQLSRTYFLNEGLNQQYDEANHSNSRNANHRVNLRLEYTIDSSNSVSIRPQLSFQDNSRFSRFFGQNYFTLNDPLNVSENRSNADNSGYSFSNDLLYRHRFAKRGRSVSLNLGTSLNDKSGTRFLYSRNQYFDDQDTTETLDQKTLTDANGSNLSASLVYTEPLGKTGQLQFNYAPSLNRNQSNRETNNLDSITGLYSIPESLLSNRFENEVATQRSGLNYNLRGAKNNFSVGLNYQNVSLNSRQLFPTAFTIDKTFQNFLPSMSYNYRPSKKENLRIQYRTSTNVPNINQLQNVLDNSNPLLLSIGNPDLVQPYGHAFTLRYNRNNPDKATSFIAFGYLGLTQHFIANSSFIALRDTSVLDSIPLLAGAQLSRPVNLGGYWNARSFFTYGLPLGFLKSNLNLNAGFSFVRSPGQVNEIKNLVSNYTTNAGLVLSSNVSEKLDFTLSYNANFSVVENSLQAQLSNNYFYQNAGVKLSWEFAKRLTLTSDMNQSLYTGLGDSYNRQFWLWNAAIGYRLLKNEALELKLGVFDILAQNNSIVRTVTETYVEDTQTDVLRRYFMVTAIYSLRNFGGK